MGTKTIKITYWILTVLLVLFMIMDGIGGITRQKDGVEVMRHLGYPIYSMVIFGIAKLLGAVAIIQTKYKTIKEWAFAGLTFTFIGAFASRAFAGDGIELLFPVVFLVYLVITYIFWKKFDQLKLAG